MQMIVAQTAAPAALLWILVYLAIWLMVLWLSSRFREDFVNWITLKDPFGFRFWRQNLLFAAFSLAYLAVAFLFLGG